MGRLQDKRLFLLDMDGTIYLDDRLFDGVTAFLSRIREKGGRYLFLTNNSSKGVEGYIEKLNGMGIATGREDYLTSVDAAIDLLRRRYPGRRCYVQGTRSFYDQLAAAGIPVTCDREDGAEILLSGFDRELTFQKLEDACILLNRGAGREPEFIGKPQPAMVRLALEGTGYPPEAAVLLGDRLYTDIACAVNAGIDSVFVLSGEGTRDDIERDGIRPTWVYDDINAVFRAWEETP